MYTNTGRNAIATFTRLYSMADLKDPLLVLVHLPVQVLHLPPGPRQRPPPSAPISAFTTGFWSVLERSVLPTSVFASPLYHRTLSLLLSPVCVLLLVLLHSLHLSLHVPFVLSPPSIQSDRRKQCSRPDNAPLYPCKHFR